MLTADPSLVADFLERNRGDMNWDVGFARSSPVEPPDDISSASSKLIRLTIRDRELVAHAIFWFWRPNATRDWSLVPVSHWAVQNARHGNWIASPDLPARILDEIVPCLPEDVLRSV